MIIIIANGGLNPKYMFTSIIGKIYFGELVNSLKILSFIGETIMILVIGEIVKKEIVGSTRFYIGDEISFVKEKSVSEKIVLKKLAVLIIIHLS